MGVCDSPNLYFAIEPDGNIGPCCDYKLERRFLCYDPDFPKKYWDGKIHQEIFAYTRKCNGCMYGSYPEISVTARYLIPQLTRFLFFNTKAKNCLKKVSAEELKDIAMRILEAEEARTKNA